MLLTLLNAECSDKIKITFLFMNSVLKYLNYVLKNWFKKRNKKNMELQKFEIVKIQKLKNFKKC